MRVKDLQENEFQYFYKTYLNTLDEQDDLKSALQNGKESFKGLVHGLTDGQFKYSYGEGKWTVAEVLVHLKVMLIKEPKKIYLKNIFLFVTPQ